MNRFFRHRRNILIFLGILVPMFAKADTWTSPIIKTYYSENKEYKLIVTPRSFSAQGTTLMSCTAELYRINESESIQIWKKPLVNVLSPVHAIVANDGSSIATFDNWYSKGYGVNVFVVYNEKGEAKKTYKLEEVTPFPLNDYLRSISSLHWYAGVRFIDNERIEIIFETETNKQARRIYKTKSFEFEE